jgi:hypothetical protein
MDRIFQIVAVIMAVSTIYFLWDRYSEGAFVTGVLACVAFFLSLRFQLKERNRIREGSKEETNRTDEPTV